MSERDLTIFFTKSYHLSQAIFYLAEMCVCEGGRTPSGIFLNWTGEFPGVAS